MSADLPSSNPEEIPAASNAQSDQHPTAETGERPPVWTSHELLRGRREAWIEHAGQLYRLRLTSSGKLYLTK